MTLALEESATRMPPYAFRLFYHLRLSPLFCLSLAVCLSFCENQGRFPISQPIFDFSALRLLRITIITNG